jgi:steroid delta-isomerase-like uncharacterized protein
MSAENKAVVRRYIEEVWNQRKLNVLDELIDPNYVEHDPASPDFGRGVNAARSAVNLYLAAFPDTNFTIEEMVAEGDRVVTRWTARATHKGELRGIAPTGRKVTVAGTTISRIAGGKIVEAHVNWDALGLFQQLGAYPEQAKGRAAR